jgi:hypothetical protein
MVLYPPLSEPDVQGPQNCANVTIEPFSCKHEIAKSFFAPAPAALGFPDCHCLFAWPPINLVRSRHPIVPAVIFLDQSAARGFDMTELW